MTADLARLKRPTFAGCRVCLRTLVLLAFVATMGTLLGTPAALSVPSSLVLGWFAPWFVVLAFAGGFLTQFTWRGESATWARRAFLVVSAATAAAALWIVVSLIHTGARHGVEVDVLAAFRLRPQPDVRPDETVVVATLGRERLAADVYRPTSVAGGPRPAILYIHGGGFRSGDKSQMPGRDRWFAGRGYVVVDVQYRLSQPRRPTWNIAIRDVACAMAWLHSNAARYGVDTARIAVMGDSAGGSLALNAAYRAAAGTLRSSCGTAGLPVPRAVVTFYPGIDLAAAWQDNGWFGSGKAATEQYLGGSPRALPARYASTLPTEVVNASSPPTLVVTGRSDSYIEPHHARVLKARLRAAGVTAQLVELPYLEHAYNRFFSSIGAQIERGVAAEFLARHLSARARQGPATSRVLP